MLPIWAIQAGVTGAKALYGLLKPKQKFESTTYGQRLKMRMAKGDIPMEAQQNVISGVAKATGNAASIAKAEEQGRLVSTGMGNSISGTAGLRDIGTRYQDRLATVAERLASENEMTKAQAGNEYAQASTGWDEQVKAEKQANIGQLFGAAGEAIMGKYKQQEGTISGILGQEGLTADQQRMKLLDLNVMDPDDITNLLESHWSEKEIPSNTYQKQLMKRTGITSGLSPNNRNPGGYGIGLR